MQAALTPTDLAGGSATLCFTTDDPAARRQAVPLTMNVTPEWRLFLPWLSR